MAEYKAYEVGPDGRLLGIPPIEFVADDDDAAKARLQSDMVEMWCGSRLVYQRLMAVKEPEGASATAPPAF